MKFSKQPIYKQQDLNTVPGVSMHGNYAFEQSNRNTLYTQSTSSVNSYEHNLFTDYATINKIFDQ